MTRPAASACTLPEQTPRSQSILTVAVGIILLAVIITWRAPIDYTTGVFDIYGLYWGGHALLETGQAYDLSSVVPTSQHTDPLYTVGNVYPLPAVLLALPLTILTPLAASLTYLAVAAIAMIAACLYGRLGPWPLLWLPLWSAFATEQPAAIITAAELALLGAAGRHHQWRTAALIAICLVKPNQTFLIVAYIAWQQRHQWKKTAVAVTALWLPTLLIQPDWPQAWITAVSERGNEVAVAPTISWWILIVTVTLWRAGDRLGAAITTHLALMPTPGTDIYPAAHLILGLTRTQAITLTVLSIPAIIVTAYAGATWGLTVFALSRVLTVRLHPPAQPTTPAATT